VQEAVDRLLAGRTVFVIAHRLSTITHANTILVLDHGRIVERGTHAGLLAERGAYYRLHALQFRDERVTAGV
jgi:ABC-type multidrug transport system fused ATPase/permease subunit